MHRRKSKPTALISSGCLVIGSLFLYFVGQLLIEDLGRFLLPNTRDKVPFVLGKSLE